MYHGSAWPLGRCQIRASPTYADDARVGHFLHPGQVLVVDDRRVAGDLGGSFDWWWIPSGKLLQTTMERSTIFNGKTHYFYGHFQ